MTMLTGSPAALLVLGDAVLTPADADTCVTGRMVVDAAGSDWPALTAMPSVTPVGATATGALTATLFGTAVTAGAIWLVVPFSALPGVMDTVVSMVPTTTGGVSICPAAGCTGSDTGGGLPVGSRCPLGLGLVAITSGPPIVCGSVVALSRVAGAGRAPPEVGTTAATICADGGRTAAGMVGALADEVLLPVEPLVPAFCALAAAVTAACAARVTKAGVGAVGAARPLDVTLLGRVAASTAAADALLAAAGLATVGAVPSAEV